MYTDQMKTISRLTEPSGHQFEAFLWPVLTLVPWGQIIQNDDVQNFSTPIEQETKFLGSHFIAFHSVLTLDHR